MALYEYVGNAGDPSEGYVPGVGGVYKGLVVDSATVTAFDVTADSRFTLAPGSPSVTPPVVSDEVFDAVTPSQESQAQTDVQSHV